MNMPASKTTQRKTRAPSGSKCPTMLMLNEQEREQLNQIAASEVRSVSATGRLMLLRGMKEYVNQTSKNQ